MIQVGEIFWAFKKPLIFRDILHSVLPATLGKPSHVGDFIGFIHNWLANNSFDDIFHSNHSQPGTVFVIYKKHVLSLLHKLTHDAFHIDLVGHDRDRLH